MAEFAARVDVSKTSPEFRRLALQPGMALVDQNRAHDSILRRWLGASLAEPSWQGDGLHFRVRTSDDPTAPQPRLMPLTENDCQSFFPDELESLATSLQNANAKTGTEKILQQVMRSRLAKYQADPALANRTCEFAKFRDQAGTWKAVWLWGFERKTPDQGQPAICAKCRSIGVVHPESAACRQCGAKLPVANGRKFSPIAILAAVLFLAALGAGYHYWPQSGPRWQTWREAPPIPTGTIIGLVVTSEGVPIADAIVSYAGTETETKTDIGGIFLLAVEAQSHEKLSISAAGFVTKEIAIPESNDLANPETIVLAGDAKLRGIVRDRLGDRPVVGAEIKLPAWKLSARTNSQGEFFLNDVPASDSKVMISATGFDGFERTVALPSAETTTLSVQLNGQGKLLGAVVDAITLQPISQATVFLLETSLTTETNAEGRFEIPGIPTGSTTIAVQADGYHADHLERELSATETTPIRVALHGASVIRGRVVSAADGQPLTGVKVTLPGDNRSIETDADGKFFLSELTPGQKTLEVNKAGFSKHSASLTASENSEPATIRLAGNAAINGTITDAQTKKPLGDVEVRIAGTQLTTRSDENGEYQLPNVPGRDVTVQFVGRGYRQVDAMANLKSQRTQTLDAQLKGGTILSGVVEDQDTKTPIENATVQLTGTDETTTTDASGRFRFEELVAGPHTVRVMASGYDNAEKQTDLTAENEAALTVPLVGNASFSGRVFSAHDEQPLSKARIVLLGTDRSVETDETGQFQMPRVPGGSRDFEISHPGYDTANIARDLPAGETTSVEILLTGAAAVTGRVVDASDQPIGNAIVGWKNQLTSSDALGRFRLADLLPGPVDLTVSAKGFSPRTVTAELSADEPTVLSDVVLEPLGQDVVEIAKPFETLSVDNSVQVLPVTQGNATDIEARLRRENAKSGDVQVSLAWDNINDLDLHVKDPSGEVIYFRNRRSESNGELDVDMNANRARTSEEPVENIVWPLNTAPRGTYQVVVDHYENHGASDPTPFQIMVKNGDEVNHYTGEVKRRKDKVLVCEFTRDTGPEPNLAQTPPSSTTNAATPATTEVVTSAPSTSRSSSNEDIAAGRLKLAQSLLKRKKAGAAQRWLTDITELYPGTSAARTATSLLDQLAGTTGTGDTADSSWVYLADLTPTRTNISGKLQVQDVTMDGDKRLHSLWTRTNLPNPPASVEYALGRKYLTLSGAVGIDESGKFDRTWVSTSFEIVGDGKVLWTSKVLREPGSSQKFAIDVSTVKSLKILAESDRIPSHYAVWVDPYLSGRGREINE